MYKSILVPVDLSEESSWRKSLPTAVAMARTFNSDLHVMTVVPDFGRSIVGGYFPEGFEAEALEKAANLLREFIAGNVPDDITAKGHVAHGVIYEEIDKVADKLGCDMIVLASHRPELKDYLLGPNAARVVRHAGQSVLVVRE